MLKCRRHDQLRGGSIDMRERKRVGEKKRRREGEKKQDKKIRGSGGRTSQWRGESERGREKEKKK